MRAGFPSDRERADADVAAAWLARLKADEAAAFDPSLAAWLAEDAGHARAFDQATQIWEELGGVGAEFDRAPPAPARARWARTAVGAMAALLILLFAGIGMQPHERRYQTHHGERRVVMLEDGSCLTLNTDSRATVRMGWFKRKVRLEAGEALFEVAKDARRPFLVDGGYGEVRAVGTAFVVQRDRANLVVTVFEGTVRIGAPSSARPGATPPPIMLHAGSRWDGATSRVALLDRDALDAALAWRRGEIVLDDVAVAAAVAQVNRYGRTPVVIDGRDVGSLRVSGIFQAGQSLAFARTLGAAYDLRVQQKPGRIVISEPPPKK